MSVYNSFPEFSIKTNVDITVENRKRKIIRKQIVKHNKATRQLVTGLLRFMTGNFNASSRNSKPYYNDTEQYIPCYIGVGDGGVVLDENGYPTVDTETRIPTLASSWNSTAPYIAKKLVREFFVNTKTNQPTYTGSRTAIRKIGETYTNETTVGDMDTVYFYCEIGPGELNAFYNNQPVVLTEIGLFGSSIPNTQDLLAYVKLDNTTDENGNVTTDTLYVRPEDTVVIKWYITIAAVGEDSLFAGAEEAVVVTPVIGDTDINIDPEPEPEPPTPGIILDPNAINIIYTDQEGSKTLFKFFEDGDNSNPVTVNFLRTGVYTDGTTVELYPGCFDYIVGQNVDFFVTNSNKFSINDLGTGTLRCFKDLRTSASAHIPDKFFYKCMYLEEVVLNDSCSSIGGWAFEDCSSLTEIDIPDNVRAIGIWAFGYCTNLQHINFSENSLVGTDPAGIREAAFYGCQSLKEFIIPPHVDAIRVQMFGNCTRLERIVVPSTVTHIYGSGGQNPGAPMYNVAINVGTLHIKWDVDESLFPFDYNTLHNILGLPLITVIRDV